MLLYLEKVIKLGWIREEGKFNENIYLIDPLLYASPGSLACYFVKGKKKNVLIDSGGIDEGGLILDKLNEMKLRPDIIILTHSHWDHAAATPKIKEKFPNLEVMASQQGIESLKKMNEFNEAFSNVTTGLPPIENVTPLKDGDVIDLGGSSLKIYETPGHSNCSISIIEHNSKILFVGDSLGNKWAERFFMSPIMPPEFSEEKLLSTFEKVKNIDYSNVGLAHFGILTDDSAQEYLDNVKSAFLFWRDFFISTWNKNPNHEFFYNEFSKKLQEKGILRQDADLYIKREGDWILKALKIAHMI